MGNKKVNLLYLLERNQKNLEAAEKMEHHDHWKIFLFLFFIGASILGCNQNNISAPKPDLIFSSPELGLEFSYDNGLELKTDLHSNNVTLINNIARPSYVIDLEMINAKIEDAAIGRYFEKDEKGWFIAADSNLTEVVRPIEIRGINWQGLLGTVKVTFWNSENRDNRWTELNVKGLISNNKRTIKITQGSMPDDHLFKILSSLKFLDSRESQ